MDSKKVRGIIQFPLSPVSFPYTVRAERGNPCFPEVYNLRLKLSLCRDNTIPPETGQTDQIE
jgi:hypothetical protein